MYKSKYATSGFKSKVLTSKCCWFSSQQPCGSIMCSTENKQTVTVFSPAAITLNIQLRLDDGLINIVILKLLNLKS